MTTPTDAGSADHERIWLQPRCCSGGEGRLWCEDNVFEDECEGGAQPTEYLRADIAADRILALETRIREMEGKYESVMAGTWFYPDGDTDSCYLDPAEVLDERYFDWHGVRSGVFPIERALRLPDIYAAVRAYSEAEKEARNSDDEYSVTWHLSEEEARAALKAQEPNQ